MGLNDCWYLKFDALVHFNFNGVWRLYIFPQELTNPKELLHDDTG